MSAEILPERKVEAVLCEKMKARRWKDVCCIRNETMKNDGGPIRRNEDGVGVEYRRKATSINYRGSGWCFGWCYGRFGCVENFQ